MPASLDDLLPQLSPPCGYTNSSAPATEPTAWSALALAAGGQIQKARAALDWMAGFQTADGSVGISATENSPCWTTALAVLAWTADASSYRSQIRRATTWLLSARGKPQPRTPEMGHDSTLVGWPWVLGTHSWLEPTAWSVLALKAAGQSKHPRTREAVRLLFDRLLPGGGCNYGNTTVLGQQLRPHLQPTGLVLMALAGERAPDARLQESLQYLEHELSADTPTASLCYGLLGLAAHKRTPAQADSWLLAAAGKTMSRNPSDWRLAMIVLAHRKESSPLLRYSS